MLLGKTLIPRVRMGMIHDFSGFIYWKELFTHLLILAKSGGGKSTLIANIIQQISLYFFGLIFVDPSGFTAKDVYSILKMVKGRGKVLYLKATSPRYSLNPMQNAFLSPSATSDIIAASINQCIISTTANERLTSKMRDILDTAVRWCLKNNRLSLLSVRDYIMNMNGSKETRDGIISRLNFLLSDKAMRQLICGSNIISFTELVKNGDRLILDCQGLSADKMVFVGTLLIQQAVNWFRFEFKKLTKPLMVIIDEAHNFVSKDIMPVLSEGRKYGLSCVLSTQSAASIDQKLFSVMLNVGSHAVFNVGYREASMLAKEMLFDSSSTLQTLEKYYLAFRSGGDDAVIVKAPRPPIFKKLQPPVVKPKPKSKGWFPLIPA
jgi:type IV secretory pathway TraG/TraD family ATPase VirD4